MLKVAEQDQNASAMTRAGIQRRLSTDLRECREALEKTEANEALKARLHKELEEVEEKISGIPPVDDPEHFRSIFPLNELHARIFAVHGALAKAAGSPSLSVWSNNRYDFLTPTERPPVGAKASILISAMKEETRSGTFNLTNGTEDPITVMVRIEGLPVGSNPEYIAVHRIEWTDTKEFVVIAAALVPVEEEGEGYPISVPAGMTRQVWLDFRPRGMASGKYRGRVVIERPGASGLEVPLTLRVFNETFPEKPTLHVGGWDYTNQDWMYGLTPENIEPLIVHLRERYVDTTWATSGVFLPAGANTPADLDAFFDDSGRMIKEPDTAAFDRWVARWPSARRYGVFFNILNVDGIGDLQRGTSAFARAVGEWIRFWVKHAGTKGIKPEQIMLLLVDEAGNHHMDQQTIDWAKPIRAAQTGVLIWIDPTHPIPCDALPEVWEVTDVFCPHRGQFLGNGKKFADFYRKLLQSGRQLEFYSCSTPGFSLDPYSYYRLQAWTCFEMGATATYFWAFSCSGKRWQEKGSCWNQYITAGTSDSAVFLGPDSVTPAKHMEAIRESVQDYEYLVMLRERISKTEKIVVRHPALPKARMLLNDACDRVLKSPGTTAMRWDSDKDRSIADEVIIEIGEILEQMGNL